MAYENAPTPGTERSRRADTFRRVKAGVRIPARTPMNRGIPVLGVVEDVKKLYPWQGKPLTKTARRKLACIARNHGEAVRSLATL